MLFPPITRRNAARALLLSLGLTTCALVAAEEPTKGMSRGGRAKALLIGVADYNDPAVSDLMFSHRDVYALAETLLRSGHYGTEDLIVMTTDHPSVERRPTLYNLQRELAALEEVHGASSLLVYFSGHGVGELEKDNRQTFLLPQDVDTSTTRHLIESALSVAWLEATLQRMTGFRAHALLMDACRSAPPGEKSVLNGRFGPPKTSQRLSVVPSGPDLHVMYSAGYGLSSFEDQTLQLGQFTHAMIRGLEGEADGVHMSDFRVPDGQVTVMELQAFAANMLSELENHPQTPTLSGEFVQDLVIAPSQPSLTERRRAVRCPSSPRAVAELAKDALQSFSVSDPVDFLRAAEQVTWSAECADDVLPSAVVGDLHRVQALRAFLVQDLRTARLTFSTLHDMGLAPLTGVPGASMALITLAHDAETPARGTTFIGHPAGVEVWVNGRPTNERPIEGVAFVQVRSWDGSIQTGAWLRPEQPAPFINLPPPDDWLRPTKLALGLGAGATALAGAGFFVCNLIHVSAFSELSGDIRVGENLPEDPLANLEELQRRANVCAAGATLGGALSVGLGAGALGLTIKF